METIYQSATIGMAGIISILRIEGNLSTNKNLVRQIGLHCATLYCELASKSKYFTERETTTVDDYFFNTAEDIFMSTGLTPFQQRKSIEELKKIGLIETKIKGMPSKKYFKIADNPAVLLSLLHEGSLKYNEFKLLRNCNPRNEENAIHDVKKLHTNNTKGTISSKQYKDNDYASLPAKDVKYVFENEDLNEVLILVNKYIKTFYPSKRSEKHPPITKKKIMEVCIFLYDFMAEKSFDIDSLELLMHEYLDDRILVTNYSISHFATQGILENRYNRYLL